MAKTLIVKGTDFSTNKIETVNFGDLIPCTGITIDESTLTIQGIGSTATLVATPTPSNTTDEVVWTSSDNDVATVENGVVTAAKIGYATITATCGNYSASCSIMVTALITGAKIYPDAYTSGNTSYSGGNGIVEIASAGTSRGVIAAESGTYSIRGTIHSDTYYPIVLPSGAKRIKATYTKDDIRIQCMWFCSSTTPASGTSNTQLVDKIIRENITVSNNVSITEIPQHDGYPTIDAIVFALLSVSYATFTESDFDTITLEALPEEQA